MQKFQAKQNRVGSGVQSKSSINQLLESIKRFESHSTQQNIIFQHYIILRLFIKNGSHG